MNPLLKGPVFGVLEVGGFRCGLALCMSESVLVLCVLPVCARLLVSGEGVVAAVFPVRDWDEEAVTAGQISDDGAIHRATGAKIQTVRNVSHSAPLLSSLFLFASRYCPH